MSAVAERDLHQVLDVIDALAPSPDGHLSVDVLAALHALVPSDDVSLMDMDVQTRTFHVLDAFDGSCVTSLPEPEHAPDDPFWQHYAGSRFCSYPTASGDHRSVTMVGDFYSSRQWRQTPMYNAVFAADGVTDELMCPLAKRGTRSLRLLFFRRGGAGFSERERLVMALLRPHLAEAMQAAPVGLTGRQTELLRLVAAGHTNAQIAAAMFVSPHTVRKHLENIFERLGVTTRTAAVARAFG